MSEEESASRWAVVSSVQAARPHLRAAAARLADLIIADPDAVLTSTISELADRAGTSASTVTRLCRDLGHAGFREFRTALAAERALRHEYDGASEPAEDISESDDIASVVRKITRADLEAVRETARTLSLDRLRAVVGVLVDARRVWIYGIGGSGVAAFDLEQKLERLGRDVLAARDVHHAITAAALLGPRDVAIAISHTGSTPDAVDALRVARDQGAVAIAITNVSTSPLAQLADHVLLTASHERAQRAGATASRMAQLTVVDCVYVALAQTTLDSSRDSLQRTAAALQQLQRH